MTTLNDDELVNIAASAIRAEVPLEDFMESMKFAYEEAMEEVNALSTDYSNQVVTRSAPRWAWQIMDETLEMDTKSKGFDFNLRVQIRNSLTAMRECCEFDYGTYTQAEAEEEDLPRES